MKWPGGKSFGFAIVDDTDSATVDRVRPVYELLAALGVSATKTVWVYPSRDKWKGQSLADPDYLDFIRFLQTEGFEIGLHGVGSGSFTRDEIVEGLGRFRELIGYSPRLHANHSHSLPNVYWGHRRFVPPVSTLYQLARFDSKFEGENPASPAFWGDYSQGIDYIRNLVFRGIDTLQSDPHTPYREASKPYAKYWFSASDGETATDFTELISKANVDALERSGGACIVYTHFAVGFVRDGRVDPAFASRLAYLAQKDGWFVPASELLDYLLARRDDPARPIGYPALLGLNLRWLAGRVMKRVRLGR